MSDLTITTAGVSESKVSGGEFLSSDKKLNQMKVDVISITPETATSECSAGEVVFQADEVENMVAVKGGTCILQSITLLDDDDHGDSIDIVFNSGNGLLDASTAGSTPIDVDDDTSSVPGGILGVVTVSSYFDGVNWKLGTKENIGLVLKAADDTRSIYISAVNRGSAQTWTASGLHLKLGVVQD